MRDSRYKHSRGALQSNVKRSPHPDAGHHGEAEVDGERDEDAGRQAAEEKFDFLGYTFGRCYSSQTGRTYLGTVPSKKRVSRICEAISSETGRNKTLLDQATVVGTLNR